MLQEDQILLILNAKQSQGYLSVCIYRKKIVLDEIQIYFKFRNAFQFFREVEVETA